MAIYNFRIAFFAGGFVFVATISYFRKHNEKRRKAQLKALGEFTDYKPASEHYLGIGLLTYYAILSLSTAIVLPLAPQAPCPNHIAPFLPVILRIVFFGCAALFVGLAVYVWLLRRAGVRKLVLDEKGIHELGPKSQEHIPWASIRDVEMEKGKPGICLLLRDGKKHRLVGYNDLHDLAAQVADRIPLQGSGLDLPMQFGFRYFRIAALPGITIMFVMLLIFVFQLSSTWGESVSNTASLIFLVALFAVIPITIFFTSNGMRLGWVKVTDKSVEMKSIRRDWFLPLSDIRQTELVPGYGRIVAKIQTSAGETIQVNPSLDSVKLMRSIRLAQGHSMVGGTATNVAVQF